MPTVLMLNTPPSTAAKRPRSRESIERQFMSSSTVQGLTSSQEDVTQSMARFGIRMPSYLNKTRSDISAAFFDLEWQQRLRISDAVNNPATSPFRTDRSVAVLSRNRYMNVQPWASSRVKLKTPLGGSDYVNASPIKLNNRSVSSNTTVNPSSSTKPRSSKPDHEAASAETRYIATQGPKEGQFPHFWHMVLQETTGDVGVIVMLTQCYEGNKEKCAAYFPQDMSNAVITIPSMPVVEDSLGTVDHGDPFLDSDCSSADTDSVNTDTSNEQDLTSHSSERQTDAGTVELLSLTDDASIGCEVRKLKLTIGSVSKVIYHYLYKNWADFGKPEVEDRLALMQLTRISKDVVGPSPRIVHCSAGVGRTGTWIALDFLLRELETGRLTEASHHASSYLTSKRTSNQLSPDSANKAGTSTPQSTSTWGRSGPAKIPATTPEARDESTDLIYETVNTLREQRMMMVMNELQYTFLYDSLKEAFIEKYAEKQTGTQITPSTNQAEQRQPQQPSSISALQAQPPTAKFPKRTDSFNRPPDYTRLENGQDDDQQDNVSEAETEIMEREKSVGPTSLAEAAVGEGVDPYAAVAPETARKR